jgi:hypothetical protein
MQHRHMPVGEPGAFVEVTASECAEPVQMRLDVAKQGGGKMYAEQVGKRRIGTVEIHTGGVGREQSRSIIAICDAIILARLH